jgi:hypothetical protein
LILVFSPDLEKVEEVCCGGVDCDEVFVGLRRGRGKGDYLEVFRALELLVCTFEDG